MAITSSNRFTFPRRMRLSRGRQFMNVYEAKVRASIGPLLIYSRPNDVGFPRLGMAVPRAVGTAVRRNTIKRRIRESFRLLQHDWPADSRSYDLVISVRPHKPLPQAEYRQALERAMSTIVAAWKKKSARPTPRGQGE